MYTEEDLKHVLNTSGQVIIFTNKTRDVEKCIRKIEREKSAYFVTELLSAFVNILHGKWLKGLSDGSYDDYCDIIKTNLLVLYDVWELQKRDPCSIEFLMRILQKYVQKNERNRIIFISEGESNILEIIQEYLKCFAPKIIVVRE